MVSTTLVKSHFVQFLDCSVEIHFLVEFRSVLFRSKLRHWLFRGSRNASAADRLDGKRVLGRRPRGDAESYLYSISNSSSAGRCWLLVQNEAAEGRDKAAAGRCWLQITRRPLKAEMRILPADLALAEMRPRKAEMRLLPADVAAGQNEAAEG